MGWAKGILQVMPPTYMSTPDMHRTIERGGRMIEQVRIGEEWRDLCIWAGDLRHPFRYGKHWTEHVKDQRMIGIRQ